MVNARARALIPIKYKFLLVLLALLLGALAVFFFFAYRTFSEDKKVFIMDLNLSLLKAASTEVRAGLQTRLGDVQGIIPRIYNPGLFQLSKADDVFEGFSPSLASELLGVTFYRQGTQGEFQAIREFRNRKLYEAQKLPDNLVAQLDSEVPLPLAAAAAGSGTVEIFNRSTTLQGSPSRELAILTVVFSGKYVDKQAQGVVISVDLLQTFLQRALMQSDVAEMFLVRKNGTIVSHPNQKTTVRHARSPIAHPVVERLKARVFPKESVELVVDGAEYFCNISDSGFPDVYMVSQVRKDQAFLALTQLIKKSLLIAAIILCLSVVASVIFVNRLTLNIDKLRQAAEEIGRGNLNLSLHVKSNDELQSVAESFEWMSARLSDLIFETAKKARMEGELKTARLVQSTLLNAPQIVSEAVELSSHLVPATDLGGDFWDAYLSGKTLTVLIGDATGHGAPAALVTAIAKSCFSTLNTIYHAHPLEPEQVLSALNFILYGSCQGKLLMTMCIVQLDLDSGDLLVCNAGHESPLVLRAASSSPTPATADKKEKIKAEVLFSRGERLGFSPEGNFEAVRHKLSPGDTIMLYTDGVTEAHDSQGKEWGERALKKTFAKGGARATEQIKRDIVEAVGAHMGGAEQGDDITFVLLKWKGKASFSLGASPAPVPVPMQQAG